MGLELLKEIDLNLGSLKKISPEIAAAIERLDALSAFAESDNAPPNIREAYKSLYVDIQRKLSSPEFAEAARKKGVTISTGIASEEEIVVEAIPQKPKTLKDLVAQKKKKKDVVEEVVEIETPPVIEPPEPEDEEEIPTPAPDTSEMVGLVFRGDEKAELTGKVHFTMLLSYGGSPYILGMYNDADGYNYHLSLPKSAADIVITLPITPENAAHTSIVACFEAYLADKNATINVVGRNKEMIAELGNTVKGSSSFKEDGWLTASELASSKYDVGLYDGVNDTYSLTMNGQSYYDKAKTIKQSWEAKEALSELGSKWGGGIELYGFNYADYIYRAAERYYENGGSKIVVKKHTFYAPKGLTKSETFAETETNLDPLILKEKKFAKNLSLGKRFQAQTNKLEDADVCRVLGSTTEKDANEVYLQSESGNLVKISRLAYNHFRKYYKGIQARLSDETIVMFSDGNVVGLISTEKSTQVQIDEMFEPSKLKTELRNIDTSAYDFMVSEEGVIEEKAAEIEVAEEEEKVEEVEESKWTEQLKLKEELVDRVEFLEELYEEALEDDDDQNLIDELEGELEILGEILQETIAELLEVDADAESTKLLKSQLKWINGLLKKL